MALSYAGPTRQRDLAELISADSTTLTRTLGHLESEGLLMSQAGEDRRERIWAVTPLGRERLDAAKPLWERAQADLRGRLGPEDWDTLKRLLAKVVQAA